MDIPSTFLKKLYHSLSPHFLAPSLNCSGNHSTVTVLFNGSLTLTCNPVDGTLPIYYRWRLQGTSEVIYNNQLELSSSSLMTGYYTCIASNQWGEASLVTHVVVQGTTTTHYVMIQIFQVCYDLELILSP